MPDAGDPHLLAIDGRLSTFASDGAHLVAAERRHEADGAIGVDPDRAGPDPVGHGEGAADVRGPDARCQPVDPVVLERNDREDRTEDIFAGDAHAVGDIAGESYPSSEQPYNADGKSTVFPAEGYPPIENQPKP